MAVARNLYLLCIWSAGDRVLLIGVSRIVCSVGESQLKSVQMEDFGVYAIFGVDEPPQQILR